MRSWIILAALLGSGAALSASATDAFAAQQQAEQTAAPRPLAVDAPQNRQNRYDPKSRESRNSHQPSPSRHSCDLRTDAPDSASRPSADPSTGSSPPAPQSVFIISCNASGCHDNQGHFLTRSGPQNLVGPNGIRCQSMGGNWQCNAPAAP